MTSFYIDDLIAVESRFDLYVFCKQETMTHLEFRYKEIGICYKYCYFLLLEKFICIFFYYSFNKGFQSTTYSQA